MVWGMRLREWAARPRLEVSESGHLATTAPRYVTIADREGLKGLDAQVVLGYGDAPNARLWFRDRRKSLHRKALLQEPSLPRWRVRLMFMLDSRFGTSNLLSSHDLGGRVSSDAP